MRRARYRLGQFFSHLWPRPLGPDERAEVETVLGAGLAQLFRRQTAGEQAHSLRVMRAVAAVGEAADGAVAHGGGSGRHSARRELLQAALLHDVGKSAAPINLMDRALIVVVHRFAPDSARRWGQGPAAGLRRPFVTALCHADWGADLCAQAGASPVTVDLIRRHPILVTQPATPEDKMLALLQAADDDN